jgi:hypothetical protein
MNITDSENEALKVFFMTATFVSHVLHSLISLPLNHAVSFFFVRQDIASSAT